MRTLFLFIALVFITSCGDKNHITMLYQETQCSDAWYDSPGNSIEEAVIEYFEENHNIKLEDVKIRIVDTGAACLACSCSSGREIEVNVDEKNVSILEDENFMRK